MFSSAIQAVTVIFLLIAVGFFCQRFGWLGDNASTVLSRVTLRIGMPGLVISNVLGSYSRAMLLDGAVSLIVPLTVLTTMYLLSRPLAYLLKIPPERTGVFRAMFTFGNAVFLGMPVCVALFGESATTTVLLYYLVNTTFWWLIGAPGVAKDGGRQPKNALSRLLTPPLAACLISIALVLLGIRLPPVVMKTASYLGALVTPLSMLFIGMTLSSLVRRGVRWQRGYGPMLLGRCVLGPIICLPLCLLLKLPPQTLGVFFVQSGLPTQTQTCLWAQEHGADAEYAAGGIILSTLLGLLAIPLYAVILGALQP